MGVEKINLIRKEKGLTTKQLSERSGVPLGTLNKILSGTTKDPKLETLKAIVKVLECSLDDLNDINTSLKSHSKVIITDDEKEILKKYRQLTDMLKEDIRDYIDMKYNKIKR